MSAKTDSANLDFLRAYAVLTVYFGHALQVLHIEKTFGRVTIYDFAQTGVLIFFVHTSLVLMLSLDRLRSTSCSRLFTVFYIRRAFRIYPLSIATVLVMLAARAPAFPDLVYSRPRFLAVLSNLTLTQNLTRSGSYPAVLWSLPYEVQMYIVLPFLFVIVRRFSSSWLPICLWAFDVAFIVVMWIVTPANAHEWLKGIPLVLQYTPCFLAGIIGYRLWSATRRTLPFFGWPTVITSCVALRVLAGMTSIPHAATLSKWLACLILGLTVSRFREVGSGWIRTFAAIIAKYSYGIYLGHSLAFWVAFILLRHTDLWIQGAVCLALSILIPLAMYHGVEKPMITVGLRLAAATGRSVAATATLDRSGTNGQVTDALQAHEVTSYQ
jgi:peptidoglycan/LPS O-acetylase OafA/YrhL